jgi:hypothetical protein
MPKRFNALEGLNENAPVDVMPMSNGEYYPPPPSDDQKMVMRMQNRMIEEERRRVGMTRREFVRTGMAMALGVMAVDAVSAARANADEGLLPRITDYLGPQSNAPNYCNVRNPWSRGGLTGLHSGVQLENLPGEKIFDLQSHHVEDDGLWRVTRPVHQVVIAGVLNGQSGSNSQETDPAGGVGRLHYFKNIMIESATTFSVLSPVPAAPDIDNPLPVWEAIHTAELAEEWTGTRRVVIHAFVMPNLGSTYFRTAGVMPLGHQGEMNRMWYWAETERSRRYLRGWKVYSPYADFPFAPSWQHHDDIGTAFAKNVWDIYKATGVPPTIATHKGPSLPGFHPTSNCSIDIGPAAAIAWRDFRDATAHLNYVVYHSGHDSGVAIGGGAAHVTYPTDVANSASNPVEVQDFNEAVDGQIADPSGLAMYNMGLATPEASATISTNSLVKSLRKAVMDGPHWKAHPSLSHGNSPNVFGEIGTTWNSVSGNRENSAKFLGKMVWHVGPQRMVWGTDCVWAGSPQVNIVMLRTLAPTAGEDGLTHTPAPPTIQAIWDTYRLPFGLNGDRWNPQALALDALPYTAGTSICDAMVAIFGEQSASNPEGWPTDGRKHPERTIRNGIFGRNAAKAYGVDLDGPAATVSCEKLNGYRANYWYNQYTDTNRQSDTHRYSADPYLYRVAPSSNMMPGPRSRAAVDALRKKDGWVP